MGEIDPAVVYKKTYWDRPPQDSKGDGKIEAIYEAVGYALSHWEQADQELANLFLTLTDSTTTEPSARAPNAVRRAYGSITSNVGRRAAVEAAAEIYFGRYWENKFVRQPLTDVLNAVQWASRRRDDIAHGIAKGPSTFTRRDGADLSKVEATFEFGCFLMPPEYNTDRTHPFVSIKKTPHPGDFWRARYTFTSKHIRQFGFQFIVLEAAIQRYIKRVREDENGEIPIVKEYLEQRSSQ